MQFSAKRVTDHDDIEFLLKSGDVFLSALAIDIAIKQYIDVFLNMLRLGRQTLLLKVSLNTTQWNIKNMGICYFTIRQISQVCHGVIHDRPGIFQYLQVFFVKPPITDGLLHLENNALFPRREMLEHLGAKNNVKVMRKGAWFILQLNLALHAQTHQRCLDGMGHVQGVGGRQDAHIESTAGLARCSHLRELVFTP